MIVRRLALVILVLSLLLALVFVQKLNIPRVKASPDIHQGDLVLTGNNVTTIEDLRFDINGSIIVEENATLILRNAIVNFTHYYCNMTFQNPYNGNPRLLVENATISASGYLSIYFYGNSSASINELEIQGIIYLSTYDSSSVLISNSAWFGFQDIGVYGFSVLNISNSSIYGIYAYDHSRLDIFNCTLNCSFAQQESDVYVSNSTILEVTSNVLSVNCSVTGLKPGFVSYWNFRLNCSVAVAPIGLAPNITLTDTEVAGWVFTFNYRSNVTISNSELRQLVVNGLGVVSVYGSSFNGVYIDGDSKIYAYDSNTEILHLFDNSKIWAVNSTIKFSPGIHDQSEIHLCWYLAVHVIDSVGQDVPSAFVRTFYPSEPGLIIVSGFTDTQGLVRLTLPEKMMNATGEYPVGNYTVEATYDIYSASASINMTENKQTILKLEDFVIPEFPSFLILPLFMMATLLAVIVYKRKHST